ncbi:Rv0518 family GDSL lipase [[Mycobacterium] holstebronense]|uniref:SGNH/GDSL hydrolase family protein n=1 Tax=[Mycobacterium] holstebronense TaxID=3064288 RepID=A0ABN9NBM5_9MYCO|nr:GDSL lipase [Mycolicibacter sp. MU0102]CAJ1503749.1 SGNH/GDSL hydrolase family protein [Mycolicibacter sp. MU0102]
MSRVMTFAVVMVAGVVAVVAGTGYLSRDHDSPRHYETVPLSASPNRIAVIGDSYTAGYEDTGRGAANWTERAWQNLAGRGVYVSADVAAEGGAGYGVRGNRGGLYGDLTRRAVQPDDALVVFFGSRNDQDVEPGELSRLIADTLGLARRTAPGARMLVIGPPWPTADVPGNVWRIRDVLSTQARVVGAEFVDPLAERWFVGLPDLIGPDGVHPTDAGHAYMADKIAPLIAGQLPKRT